MRLTRRNWAGHGVNDDVMRRLLGAFVACAALALAVPAADAAPAAGEIVFTGTGSVMGTLTIKSKVTLDPNKVTVNKGSAYTMLALVGGTTDSPEALFTTFPGLRQPAQVWLGDLAPRKYSVRLLSAGPTTVTIRAAGLRGRTVVRLRQPLPGATGKLNKVAVLDGAVARDDLAFTAPVDALVIHGFLHGDPLAYAWSLCVDARTAATPCTVTDRPRGSDPKFPDDEVHDIKWPHTLAGEMVSRVVAAGTYWSPFTHYVLVLPLGI